MQALRIEVDDGVLLGLQRTPEELAGELRLAAAVKWYEMGGGQPGKSRANCRAGPERLY